MSFRNCFYNADNLETIQIVIETISNNESIGGYKVVEYEVKQNAPD